MSLRDLVYSFLVLGSLLGFSWNLQSYAVDQLTFRRPTPQRFTHLMEVKFTFSCASSLTQLWDWIPYMSSTISLGSVRRMTFSPSSVILANKLRQSTHLSYTAIKKKNP